MAINQMDVLKHSLQTQNEQGKALIAVIERIEKIETNVNQKHEEMNEMLVEVRDRVHLEEADANRIKSIVSQKAHAVASVRYPNKDEYGAEYLELVGYARREVYKRLKTHFNVTKYTAIRHVDRENAISFVESIVLDGEFLHRYEQWRYNRIKKQQREKELA